MNNYKKELSIIVPCYNEENNISLFLKKIDSIIKTNKKNIELVFVNDGSNDNTLKNLKEYTKLYSFSSKIVSFSRNFGKEAAILAGLEKVCGKYTVIIDADLQQNPKYILEMKKILDENEEYDAVCCVQKKRKENFLIKFLKHNFYKIMNRMMEVDMVDAASDFRLMRRNVVDAILSLPENSRFSKGIFAWVGFNTCYIPYEVELRATGESKWGIKKLFKYAFNGIVSFSNSPLIFSLKLGLFNIFASFVMLVVIIILSCLNIINNFMDYLIIYFIVLFSGIILTSNGIIGKYLANNYNESKNRPKFIIKEYLENDK